MKNERKFWKIPKNGSLISENDGQSVTQKIRRICHPEEYSEKNAQKNMPEQIKRSDEIKLIEFCRYSQIIIEIFKEDWLFFKEKSRFF